MQAQAGPLSEICKETMNRGHKAFVSTVYQSLGLIVLSFTKYPIVPKKDSHAVGSGWQHLLSLISVYTILYLLISFIIQRYLGKVNEASYKPSVLVLCWSLRGAGYWLKKIILLLLNRDAGNSKTTAAT